MKAIRQDVALGYEEVGAGDPPLIFVHGWGVERSLFAPLLRAFSSEHRALAVDLRGHGESEAPMQAYSVEAYADDVAWLASERGVRRPVIIGHSMGGLVALELASRVDPRAVILLECHVAPPPSVAAALQPALDRLESDAYATTAEALLAMLLGERFDDAERTRRIAYARSLPQHVLAGALRASLRYDSGSAATRVRCPLLYLGSPTPYADLAQLRALCPQLMTGQLVGCGHYFPLEAPEQLVPMIRRFLAIVRAAGGGGAGDESLA